jgi:hypothetical protein
VTVRIRQAVVKRTRTVREYTGSRFGPIGHPIQLLSVTRLYFIRKKIKKIQIHTVFFQWLTLSILIFNGTPPLPAATAASFRRFRRWAFVGVSGLCICGCVVLIGSELKRPDHRHAAGRRPD